MFARIAFSCLLSLGSGTRAPSSTLASSSISFGNGAGFAGDFSGFTSARSGRATAFGGLRGGVGRPFRAGRLGGIGAAFSAAFGRGRAEGAVLTPSGAPPRRGREGTGFFGGADFLPRSSSRFNRISWRIGYFSSSVRLLRWMRRRTQSSCFGVAASSICRKKVSMGLGFGPTRFPGLTSTRFSRAVGARLTPSGGRVIFTRGFLKRGSSASGSMPGVALRLSTIRSASWPYSWTISTVAPRATSRNDSSFAHFAW